MAIRTIQKYTLEEISQRKQEVLQDIRIQRQVIAETTQAIFSPFLSCSNQKQNPLIRKLNIGMAIFDGFIIGMKLFRSFRKIFRKNK